MEREPQHILGHNCLGDIAQNSVRDEDSIATLRQRSGIKGWKLPNGHELVQERSTQKI